MTAEVEAAVRGPEVDLARLLAPVPGDNPAGVSVRYDGTYDEIQEARREDDPTLPQGVWKRELKKGDWKQVVLYCREALETRTKDLQIAAWLLEAWIRLYGLAGAAAGLRVVSGLIAEFWEDLHPALEDDDLEGRLAPIEWINSKLTVPLKAVAITAGEAQDGVDYTWLDWELALHASHLKAEKQEAEAGDGPPTRGEILARVSLTPRPFYERLAGDIEDVVAALGDLHEKLAATCGDESPSLSLFEEALVGLGNFTGRILTERGAMEKADESMVPGTDDEPTIAEGDDGDGGDAVRASGKITSRAEAYRLLSLAADYLMRTEPHSPAPYLVRRAIHWGGLSLADVLRELLSLGTDLSTVYRVLGIQPTEKPEE